MPPTATATASGGKTKQDSKARPPHPSNPNKPKPKPKRAGAPLDFIDTLDTIGGFHHDGPFDAASSHRNRHVGSKNPSRQAPMAAFDPSALVLPPASNPQTSQPPNSHTYPPARQASDQTMSVSMGYPAGTIAADPKAARLAEAFGIQGREAWEDFASSRGPEEGAGANFQNERSTEVISGQRRLDRDAKATSVWDMEETMRSGKPVPSSIPPVPALPHYRPAMMTGRTSGTFDQPTSNNTGLKRSKSLMQRIKKGVRSPPPVPTTEFSSPEMINAEDDEITEAQAGVTRKTSLLNKFGLGRKHTHSRRNQLPHLPSSPHREA